MVDLFLAEFWLAFNVYCRAAADCVCVVPGAQETPARRLAVGGDPAKAGRHCRRQMDAQPAQTKKSAQKN